MKKKCKKIWNNIKEMSLQEIVSFLVLLLTIIFIPIGQKTVDVKVTYDGGCELIGKKAIVYIDSGNSWNDQEGYFGTIKKDDTCTAHVKNYEQKFAVRFDPIDDKIIVGIQKIEIQILGITVSQFQGESLKNALASSINVESIYLENDIVKIVPMNEDPEIYMSVEFSSSLAFAMKMCRGVNILLLIILAVIFCYKICGTERKTWTGKQCALIIAFVIIGVIGSILVRMDSVNIVITYRNNEEVQYDVSTIYIDKGEGWIGPWEGNIRNNGKTKISVAKQEKIDWVRIDPIASRHSAEIEKIEICSWGITYAVYQKEDLMQIIESTVNVEEMYFDGDVVRIIPSNEDAELLIGADFCDELLLAMQLDETIKKISLGVFMAIMFIISWFSEKWILYIAWIKKKWMIIAGVGIGLCTGCIIFKDIIVGDYTFTYTNILYQVEPFRSLGVATKGLSGSDMADVTFAEMWHLFDGGTVNNWIKYNVFGYSAFNETYLLSPFMWLCYGLSSVGQLIRYLLKDILALVGMYLLLRDMKCDKIASWIGGIIYIFSSAMVMWGGWQHTDVSCLGPLLFFLTNKLLEEYKRSDAKVIYFWFGITFVLYVMLVAGMPTYVLYFLYLGIAYEIYNMLSIHRFSRKQVFVCIIIIAFAVLLAGLMSFAYTGNVFFSTQDYQEYRSGEGAYPMYTADKSFLISFLLPQLKIAGSSGIECNVFSGIFVLFIIPAYFLTPQEKNKTFWGCSVLVTLIFVFCRFSGYIFKYIPLLNTSRKARVIILMNFGISILSALLISQLMSTKIEKRKAIVASVIWILTIVGLITLAWYKKDDMSILQVCGMVICAMVALIGVLTLVFQNKKQISAMILLLSVAFNGAIFAKNSLQMIDSDASIIPEATDSIAYLQENATDEYRMATVGKSNFIPNLNSYYNINNMCGHVGINTNSQIINYLEKIDSEIYDVTTKTSIKKVDNWNLLRYGGVRYLMIKEDDLCTFNLDGIEYNIFYFNDGECVIELENVQPRAYVATSVEILDTQDEVLDAMMEEYKENTIYSAEKLETELTASERNSSSRILDDNGESVLIEASVDGSAYVVLSDYCNDDWKVYVNGEEQSLINCNYLFSAVYLEEAGDYTIELVYHSKEKIMYWTVTLVAWGIFLILLLAHKKVSYVILTYSKEKGTGI